MTQWKYLLTCEDCLKNWEADGLKEVPSDEKGVISKGICPNCEGESFSKIPREYAESVA